MGKILLSQVQLALKYPSHQFAFFFFCHLGKSQKEEQSVFRMSRRCEVMNPHFFQIPRVHYREPKLPGNHQQQFSARALPYFREQVEGKRLTGVSTQIGCELNCER
jgi:hypothetical protein